MPFKNAFPTTFLKRGNHQKMRLFDGFSNAVNFPHFHVLLKKSSLKTHKVNALKELMSWKTFNFSSFKNQNYLAAAAGLQGNSSFQFSHTLPPPLAYLLLRKSPRTGVFHQDQNGSGTMETQKWPGPPITYELRRTYVMYRGRDSMWAGKNEV